MEGKRGAYGEVYRRSIENPEGFWGEAAEAVSWYRRWVKRLPKTRSGKILRGTMKKIADGEPYTTPPIIDDPAILDEIRESLAGLGYPKRKG